MSKTIKIESPQIAVDITLKPLMSDEDVVANDLFITVLLADDGTLSNQKLIITDVDKQTLVEMGKALLQLADSYRKL